MLHFQVLFSRRSKRNNFDFDANNEMYFYFEALNILLHSPYDEQLLSQNVFKCINCNHIFFTLGNLTNQKSRNHPSPEIDSSVPDLFHSPFKRPSSSQSMAFHLKAKRRPWAVARGYIPGATKFRALYFFSSEFLKYKWTKIKLDN